MLRIVIGIGLIGLIYMLFGFTLAGALGALLAIVLVLITTKFTIVVAGLGIAVMFLFSEAIAIGLEEHVPYVPLRYGAIFVVGVVEGKIEECIRNRGVSR